MTQQLNARKLFLARLDRHLSSRELAQAAGFSASTLNRLETGQNPNVSTITLLQYLRLCDALAVSPDTLIEQPDQPASRESASDASGDDPQVLLALLLTVAGQVHVDVLAECLDWTLDRCHAAYERLNEQLEALGLTVYRRSGLYSLRPAHDKHEAALLRYRNHPRASQRASIISPQRARLVYAATVKPFPSDAVRDNTRKDISTLISAGILDLDSDRNHVLTEDVRYSLALDHADLPFGET